MSRRRSLATAVLVIALALAAEPPAAAQPADEPDCPIGLACRFTPAAYAQTDPDDPTAYGNYHKADRPRDGDDIRYIVIHDTEETYDRAIARFQDPRSRVSTHYVIRSSDGEITQLVHTKDIAHQAGNYWFNMHSIGIEHEGVLADGARWYTEAMYRSSARLVRYLAARYHIPLDREHILGHEGIPGLTPAGVAAMHYDPGPYWDWAHYFDLLGAPLRGAPSHGAAALAARVAVPPVLTIAPRFASNVEPLRSCARGNCTDLPPQGSNVVYLHTEPRADAPLVGDFGLHPDSSPGTTGIADWSAKAVAGQSFVVAGHRGEWTAIWFGGRLAWLEDRKSQVSAPGHGALVTPRPGRSAIPVYGAAYPEAAAYPPTVPVTEVVPLQYTIPAGQVYLGVEPHCGDYYYATFDGGDAPDTDTLVVGNRRLVEISFNHRRAFVDAADVVILH
ncbi:MAG: peptidoglycan recognition family protein [Pseudonocardiaceae bacterium]